MKGILILFGTLLFVGLLGFVGWFVYWKRKEKDVRIFSQKDARDAILKQLGKSAGQQTVLTDYFLKKNGFTVYVEFIVVNPYGVFVIAPVARGGKIVGDRERKEWTVERPDGSTEIFFNPLIQNASHVQSIRSVLPIDTPVRSVVVFFSDGATEICKSVTEAVTPKQLSKVLLSGEKRLSKKDIDDAAECLRLARD